MQYLVPGLLFAGSLVFAGNAWMGFRRGRLYFFEFWQDNLVERSRDPVLFNIAFLGSLLVSAITLALATLMLVRDWQ